MRLIVGISGASGVIMGYELLKALKNYKDCETHLIISEGAVQTFSYETNFEIEEVVKQATIYHPNTNLAASISSGSFKTDGMIIIPCSMKTLAGVATGYTSNLLLRAADVCLKEERKVVLVPREMPLNQIHLKNLKVAATAGCTIIPPVLTFYNSAETLQAQIEHVIGKILMQFGIDYKKFNAWQGESHVRN